MTICEICGRSVHRRSRVEGKMVCWSCRRFIREGLESALVELNRQREMADKYWGELRTIKNRPTYGSAYSAIPNHWMLDQAVKALRTKGKYQAFYKRLAEMYQVETPNAFVDMTGDIVPPGAIACYCPSTQDIVSKGKTMKLRTAFHEWFHHLEHQGYVLRDKIKENRQKNAKDFANACVAILEGRR